MRLRDLHYGGVGGKEHAEAPQGVLQALAVKSVVVVVARRQVDEALIEDIEPSLRVSRCHHLIQPLVGEVLLLLAESSGDVSNLDDL